MNTQLKREILAELETLGCKNEELLRQVRIELKYIDIPGASICTDDFTELGYKEPSEEEMEEVASTLSDLYQDNAFSEDFSYACERNDIEMEEDKEEE